MILDLGLDLKCKILILLGLRLKSMESAGCGSLEKQKAARVRSFVCLTLYFYSSKLRRKSCSDFSTRMLLILWELSRFPEVAGLDKNFRPIFAYTDGYGKAIQASCASTTRSWI